MMNKRKIFVILTLLFVGLVLSIMFFKRKEKIAQKPIPSLKIPEYLEGQQLTYTVMVSKNEFKFPKKVPLLEIKKTIITESQAREIAQQLGFNFEPLITENIFGGTTYIYREAQYSLIIRLKIGEIEYKQNAVPGFINKNLTNEDITFIAKKFLTDNNFYSEDEIESTSITYYQESQSQGYFPTTKENAAFYRVNFTFKVSDYPILTLNPNRSPIYAEILPDGEIFKVHIEKLSDVKESTNTYRTKSYEELIESINNDQAVTVSLNNGNINLADIPENSIKKITITGIDLGYLLTTTRIEELQPVFLLPGKADIKGYGEEIDILLYLPAISRNF